MDINIFDYEELEVLSNKSGHSVILVRHIKTGQYAVKRTVSKEEYEIYKKIQSIDNIHLPKVYTLSSDADEYTVIEEKIEGTRLSDFIYTVEWDEELVLQTVKELCDGLSELHSEGIIHRDLKPENIMYADETFKIIDFNIARIHKENAGHDTEYLGTPGYAAPEQFGFGQSDIQADIYSIGVLMNVMLTGKFPNEYLYEGPLCEVIKKCITLSPEDRYQSSLHLKAELSGYTELLYEHYCEKADVYKSENDIFVNVMYWTVIYYLISSFITNCIDKTWGIGFDFFVQTARQYLTADSYTLKEYISAIPLTAWSRMIGMCIFLIWAAKSVKDENVFGAILWIGFTIFDMHWQVEAFMNNQSLFATAAAVNWHDFANILTHIVCIGMFVKILHNIRKIDYYEKVCEDIKNNTVKQVRRK